MFMAFKSRVQLPASSLSRNDFMQVVHAQTPPLLSSIIWYRSKVDDTLRLKIGKVKGNREPVIASQPLWAQGPSREREEQREYGLG